MQSLRELFRIGAGPSSSHTMGPQRAAVEFLARHPQAAAFRVTLYGSLAATGRGHLTDVALEHAFAPRRVEICWRPEIVPAFHPNALDVQALDAAGNAGPPWRVYSVGGGALRQDDAPAPPGIYPLSTMDAVLAWCATRGETLWRWAEDVEGPGLWAHLTEVWSTMRAAIERGLNAGGSLPGGLHLRRKAGEMYARARRNEDVRGTGLLAAYALAVMEENATAGVVVTAPTCGACGTLPAVLRYVQETSGASDRRVLEALATAGIVGNLVKHNASISGAEVGCQGEVGTACAMASAAATQLMGGTPPQVEYAAEMGMEHHLGLTCDPVLGLVQIPCIERNAFAAMRAVSAADYALLGDGRHRISFDQVVQTMKETGAALSSAFRETAEGGLARVFLRASHPM